MKIKVYTDSTNYVEKDLDFEYSQIGHLHDDRYYTENEVNTLLATKLNTNGTAATSNYLKSLNNNVNISVWHGTESEYIALGTYNAYTIYFII